MVFGGRPSTASAWIRRPPSGPSASSAVIAGAPPRPRAGRSVSRGGSERLPNRDNAIASRRSPRVPSETRAAGGGGRARRVPARAGQPLAGGRVGRLELGQPVARARSVQALVEHQPLTVVVDLRLNLGEPIG